MRAHVVCFAVGLASVVVGWKSYATHVPEPTSGFEERSFSDGTIVREVWHGTSGPGMQAWLPIAAGLVLLLAGVVLWARGRPTVRARHDEGVIGPR